MPVALDAFDALAERLVRQAAPLRFALIDRDTDLDAALRLRYACALERGWIAPGDFPDGRERDEHDAVAAHVGAWDGDALVGAARFVLPAPGRRLPTEAAFELVVEPAGAVVDFGRLAVAPAYRGDPRRRAPGGIMGQAWLEIRRHRYHVLAGVASPAIIRVWRSLGFHVHVLAPLRLYHGEERHPVRVSPTTATGRAWPRAAVKPEAR